MKNQNSITTIFVNPVQRVSPQGRDRQTFTFVDPKTGEMIVTQSMNKTKEFGAGSTYSFQYNPTTNKLQTGLEENIQNPFYQLDPIDIMESYSLPNNWADILERVVKQSEITKQTYYEILDAVNPGYYTSEIKGNVTIFNMGKTTKIPDDPNFLQKFNVILYDGPNRFSDDTPRGRLAIQLVKNHKKIAANNRIVNSALHDFYISEENEAQMEKQKRQDVINDSIYNLVKLQNEGSDYLNYQVAILLTNHQDKPILKGDATPSSVKITLNEYINDSSHQMENINKFLKVNELLQTKESRERFNVMYLIQQAVNTNVIKLQDGYYIWHSKSGVPNMYKHNNYDKLISLLQTEMKTWNPEDTSVTNWFGDLYNEVKSKGVKIE